MGIKNLPDATPTRLLSAPYHGLWKGGKLTRSTDGVQMDWPAPAGGSTVLLRVPGRPAVSRTPDEAAADAAAGIEYRNYALLSGGRYGKTAPIASLGDDATSATWVYIDPTKARWLIRLRCNPSGGAGAHLVKVRRYLHVDGTTTDWSAESPVTLSPEDWSVWLAWETMCQNSTGSEVVIHNGVYGGLPGRIMKVTVSGTVNPAAPDLGLDFSFEDIEYSRRVCGARTGSKTATGKVYSRQVQRYMEIIDGVETGRTRDDEAAYEELVLVRSPPDDPNWYFSQVISPWTITTDKVITFTERITRNRYVWGAYHNDVLKLVRGEYIYTLNASLSTFTPSYNRFDGAGWWTGQGVNLGVVSWYYGDIKISEQRRDLSGAFDGSGFVPDGYSETYPITTYTSADFNPRDCEQVVADESIWYEVQPVSSVADRIGNAVVKVVEKRHYYTGQSTYVTTCLSMHAPDGNSVPGSGRDQATWHPITGVIEASDGPVICWF